MKHVIPALQTASGVFALAKPAIIRARTKDGFTFDRATIDSTGSFLIGELERLDPTAHLPLYEYTWTRDIDIRTDVSIGDEASSFTNSSFAALGGVNPNGISFIGKNSNVIPGVSVDIGKTTSPLHLWGQEISYSIPELRASMQLGRPIDQQKLDAMRIKWNMDNDQLVYIGSTEIGSTGLVNLAGVTPANAANNAAGTSALWVNKTPDEILKDVDEVLNASWAASAYSIVPSALLLPPAKLSYLISQKVSSAGNMSILKYIEENSICLKMNGTPLNMQPVKWLTGRGAGGTDRMVAYTKRYDLVRYPHTELTNTPLEYRSIWHSTTYYAKVGQVELVRPQTVAYRDGF